MGWPGRLIAPFAPGDARKALACTRAPGPLAVASGQPLAECGQKRHLPSFFGEQHHPQSAVGPAWAALAAAGSLYHIVEGR